MIVWVCVYLLVLCVNISPRDMEPLESLEKKLGLLKNCPRACFLFHSNVGHDDIKTSEGIQK